MKPGHMIALALLVVGCGKKQEKAAPPAPSPAVTPTPTAPPAADAPKAAAADPGTAAAPPRAAAAGPEQAQCKELLAKTWKAAQPGFAKLHIPVDAALEQAYTTNEYYLEPCVALSADKRDCLAKADNPIAAITTCKVSEGAATSLSLYPVDDKIGLFPIHPIAKEDGDKVLAGPRLTQGHLGQRVEDAQGDHDLDDR